MMFHVYFLKEFHYTPDLGEIADNYDILVRLQTEIESIIKKPSKKSLQLPNGLTFSDTLTSEHPPLPT